MEHRLNAQNKTKNFKNIAEKVLKYSVLSKGEYPTNGKYTEKEEYLLDFLNVEKHIPEMKPMIENLVKDDLKNIVDILGKPLHVHIRRYSSMSNKRSIQDFRFDGKEIYINLFMDSLSKPNAVNQEFVE